MENAEGNDTAPEPLSRQLNRDTLCCAGTQLTGRPQYRLFSPCNAAIPCSALTILVLPPQAPLGQAGSPRGGCWIAVHPSFADGRRESIIAVA